MARNCMKVKEQCHQIFYLSFGHNNLPGLFIKHCLTKFSFSTNIYAKNLCASKLIYIWYIYIYIYDGNICKNKTFSKTKIRVLADSLSTQIYSLKHIFREMKRQRRETMSVSLRSEHEAKMGQPSTYNILVRSLLKK